MIPTDPSLQQSFNLGRDRNDQSGSRRFVSFTVFVECVIISMQYSGVSSAVSVAWPVNIHPSQHASVYNPGCTYTLWGEIKSK